MYTNIDIEKKKSLIPHTTGKRRCLFESKFMKKGTQLFVLKSGFWVLSKSTLKKKKTGSVPRILILCKRVEA